MRLISSGLLFLITLLISCDALSLERITYQVSNADSLYSAIHQANQRGGMSDIILDDGIYPLPTRLLFNAPNIRLYSGSDQPDKVILRGNGMSKTQEPGVLLDIAVSNISIAGITLEQSSNHLIQVRSESDADHFSLSNCVLRDAWEQLLKVSGGPGTDKPYSDYGKVENCTFEYSAGIGPQFYIGGIDGHRVRNWIIRGNTFRNIASPSEHIAEHAIHLWNGASDNLVEFNRIENCDRAIGFGMGQKTHQSAGGKIQYNLILQTDPSHPYNDVGIVLESSPNTQVMGNILYSSVAYPNAIEYRFAQTMTVEILYNRANRRIISRDNAQGQVEGNVIDALTAAEAEKLWADLSNMAAAKSRP